MLNSPKYLSIDIETYSPVDIKSGGVYKYAEHEEFEVLLFAYAFGDAPVSVVDLANGESLPDGVLLALVDPFIIKTAYNAVFERTCLSRLLGAPLLAEQWECTMVKAAVLGYPFGLDAVAKVMRLPQEKLTTGKALIRYFCAPCKPTKSNGGRVRNVPCEDLAKWHAFKNYCMQDVVVERSIRERLSHFNISDTERRLWVLDQTINDNGVLIDTELVLSAMSIDATSRKILLNCASDTTQLANPNSAVQLKKWLSEKTETCIDSLSKADITELLKTPLPEEVRRVLLMRQELAKTSIKKYEAMMKAVCADGRLRGLIQFYGANRTGRWAGRLVQVHNLPQNHIEDLDMARNVVKSTDSALLTMFYGNAPDTLSQLIRTAFVAQSGRFIVADFSAIEARVIAWLANEKWRQGVFATHGKIYEASASAMFNVPIESITKGSSLRQKGKVAELALGYQGGVGALTAMGALNMGLAEDELQGLVDAWRNANRAIVRLWSDVNSAAITAIRDSTVKRIQHGVVFSYKYGALHISLPLGRELVYRSASVGVNRFGSPSISYMGMDQTTKRWGEAETYGGKLTENIVQAIARDCLAEAMLNLDREGYKTVMHVHDEVVIEAKEGDCLESVCSIMGEAIAWAPGLLLRADGYETPYYKKD